MDKIALKNGVLNVGSDDGSALLVNLRDVWSMLARPKFGGTFVVTLNGVVQFGPISREDTFAVNHAWDDECKKSEAMRWCNHSAVYGV